MGTTKPTPVVFRFLHKRRGGTNTWSMVKAVRDGDARAPEPWEGPCAWREPGANDGRRVSIYAAVVPTGEQDPDDPDDLDDLLGEAEQLADAKFRELDPGATILEG